MLIRPLRSKMASSHLIPLGDSGDPQALPKFIRGHPRPPHGVLVQTTVGYQDDRAAGHERSESRTALKHRHRALQPEQHHERKRAGGEGRYGEQCRAPDDGTQCDHAGHVGAGEHEKTPLSTEANQDRKSDIDGGRRKNDLDSGCRSRDELVCEADGLTYHSFDARVAASL